MEALLHVVPDSVKTAAEVEYVVPGAVQEFPGQNIVVHFGSGLIVTYVAHETPTLVVTGQLVLPRVGMNYASLSRPILGSFFGTENLPGNPLISQIWSGRPLPRSEEMRSAARRVASRLQRNPLSNIAAWAQRLADDVFG